MILKLNTLKALSTITSSDKFREALRCVHINGETLEATDGYILMKVTESNDNESHELDTFINSDDIKTIVSSKPIIINIDKEKIFTESLTIVNGPKTFIYPKTDSVIPEKDKGNKFTVSVKHLSRILDAFKKLKIENVTFTSTEPLKPIRIDPALCDKKALAVIMPIRLHE